MIVESLELVHLALPFRQRFVHASRTRSHGDTILVRLTAEGGVVGHGEMLPRRYVTGETLGSILGSILGERRGDEGGGGDGARAEGHEEDREGGREEDREGEAAGLAARVIGQRFPDAAALTDWIEALRPEYRTRTALFGGVELALWNALCQTVTIDFETVLGRRRRRPAGRCVTVGLEVPTDGLRRAAIDARLKGATAVKLKVGLPDDIERLRAMDRWLGGRTPLRVDANGRYDAARAEALLAACAGSTALQSVEEPFDSADEGADDVQRSLHARFGIDFVADESVCSLEEAQALRERATFQVFNLRVGKLGGLYPTRLVRDFAARHDIGVVGGSMVGESGVLTQASDLLLSHSERLDYVEGLGQNARLLARDPVTRLDGPGPMRPFRFEREACADLVRRSVRFG